LTIPCTCGAPYKMSTSISGALARKEACIFYLSIDCTR
jgi:hypothetical protein